jgi:hypothetical protein
MHNWDDWGPPSSENDFVFDDEDEVELLWGAVRLGFIFFLISSCLQAAGVYVILRILSESNFIHTSLGWTPCYAAVMIFNFLRVLDRFTHRQR